MIRTLIADYYPFGGERTITNSCAQNYKFEGKERDTETGNDDFGARYYSNRFARWLSSDWSSVPAPIPYANLANPQTLNLYAMVSDDPESFADLDGHVVRPTSLDDPVADWNAGIDALGCDRQPDSCMDAVEAAAEETEIAAQNAAQQTAGQQQAQTGNQQQSQAQNQQGTLQPDFKPGNNPTNPSQVDLQSGGQISGALTTSQQVASGQGNVKVALRQTEKKSKYEGDKVFIDVTGVQTVTNAKGAKQTQISVTVTPLSENQNFRAEGTGTLRFTVTAKGGAKFVGYIDVSIHFSPGGAFGHQDAGLIGSRGDKGASFDAP